MKDKIFKALKFITSRMFFLILGIGLTLVVSVAYATHNGASWWLDWNETNTPVTSGESLTAHRWNGLLGKVNELDNIIFANNSCLAGYVRAGNACIANNPSSISVVMPGSDVAGSPQTLSLSVLNTTEAKVAILKTVCQNASVSVGSVGNIPDSVSPQYFSCYDNAGIANSGVTYATLNVNNEISYAIHDTSGGTLVFLLLVGYIEN